MTRTVEKQWRILSRESNESEALARWLGISTVAAQVMWNRGITTPDAARAFLRPPLID